MKRTIVALLAGLALLALSACQSLYYAGITKVQWESPDGTQVMYVSGKDLQGVEASRTCSEDRTCSIRIVVEDASGIEAIRANTESLKALFESSKDYARMGRALSGVP